MSNQGYYQGAPQYPQQRVIKQRRRTPKPFGSSLKLKNELSKTGIDERSRLTQTSKRNAIEPPLLLLPGEIRNKIWDNVMSNHLISIHGEFRGVIKRIRTFHR
ncbi:hypothetical protein COCC4DRAFT_48799 [Bipolaris maydis ATCC 48331]|uniref:Uncharacterized protein n=1 Tax=Cochliobolus heterostrophus (strain C4 / ATCC 48331 / race T) TaxID=665024 RepID=N4XMX9_COCH4|nr:uncharacterized protein COCC4DRAFT_48799 [Bipolaris maydis ATCC 48331]ENI07716.1 hypothetical protein COCC4DRAFT_48799 [Bipolaris maydis ATCC 48331]